MMTISVLTISVMTMLSNADEDVSVSVMTVSVMTISAMTVVSNTDEGGLARGGGRSLRGGRNAHLTCGMARVPHLASILTKYLTD